jgi:hypothetical protein
MQHKQKKLCIKGARAQKRQAKQLLVEVLQVKARDTVVLAFMGLKPDACFCPFFRTRAQTIPW